MVSVRSKCCFIVGLLALLMLPAMVQADIGNSAVLYLRLVNSAAANGMGGCAVNRVDQHAPLYSPGAAGLFYLDNSFVLNAPWNTGWLPDLADGLHLKTWSVGAGVSDDLINPGATDKLHYNLSLSYSKIQMNYGTVEVTDYDGTVLGAFESRDQAKYYTVAGGIQYYVRVGLGFTYKKIRSDLGYVVAGEEIQEGTSEGTAVDWGVLVEVPLRELTNLSVPLGESETRYLNFDITPSFAYVKANSGDSMAYIDAADADPLPEYSKLGFSLYFGAAVDRARIGSLRLSYEKARDLVSDVADIKQQGLELNLGGILNIRFGKYKDVDGQVEYNTSGWGLELGGYARWLVTTGILGEADSFGSRLASRINLSVDRARYSGDNCPLSETTFLSVSFAI